MPDETIRSLVAATLRVIDAQAEDDGLWFKTENITEAYLQEHLRSLTAVIEQNLSRIIAILEGSPRIGVPLSEDAWTDGPYRQVLDPVVVGSPLQSKQGCSDGAPVGGPPQVCAGGESPTFEDYNRERSVFAAENPTYREGQVAFTVLNKMRMGLATQVYTSDFDPFYQDDKLPEFLAWVEANWGKKT